MDLEATKLLPKRSLCVDPTLACDGSTLVTWEQSLLCP